MNWYEVQEACRVTGLKGLVALFIPLCHCLTTAVLQTQPGISLFRSQINHFALTHILLLNKSTF